MKIAVITCYHDPDYVRARTLRAALKTLPDVKIIVVKNKHRGFLRYPEVLWKLRKVKRQKKPDAYLLTFRGQEILPFVQFITRKKPLIFDEFIIPIAYATGENHTPSLAIRLKHFLARVSEPQYRFLLKKCRFVLADTQAHAELSAKTSNMNLRKYAAVPVGTDEDVFKPGRAEKTEKFQVFYYSTGMQPLHGIPTVLEAAGLLKDNENIEFLMVGGKKPMRDAVEAARASGAHIRYEAWIPFIDLPATMRASGVSLGGPFGDTQQAHHVVTGKTYQSLACEVPTIVGASEATNEFFVDKQNALVVPQGDSAALAKAITWAYKNSKELRVIGEKGRKLYEKEFSVAAIAQKLRPLVDAIS